MPSVVLIVKVFLYTNMNVHVDKKKNRKRFVTFFAHHAFLQQKGNEIESKV